MEPNLLTKKRFLKIRHTTVTWHIKSTNKMIEFKHKKDLTP